MNSIINHAGRRVATLAVAAGALLALVSPALAAKPAASAGGYTATVSPAGPYHFGQDVYVTTNAPIYPDNQGPWIELTCYQNGVKVLGGTHAGFSAGWYYNWPFQLGPTQSWSGGAADCAVRVFHQSHNKTITDATASFHVDP